MGHAVHGCTMCARRSVWPCADHDRQAPTLPRARTAYLSAVFGVGARQRHGLGGRRLLVRSAAGVAAAAGTHTRLRTWHAEATAAEWTDEDSPSATAHAITVPQTLSAGTHAIWHYDNASHMLTGYQRCHIAVAWSAPHPSKMSPLRNVARQMGQEPEPFSCGCKRETTAATVSGAAQGESRGAMLVTRVTGNQDPACSRDQLD